jgi:hypothetical protein
MMTNTGSHIGEKTTLKRNYFFDCTIFTCNRMLIGWISGPVPYVWPGHHKGQTTLSPRAPDIGCRHSRSHRIDNKVHRMTLSNVFDDLYVLYVVWLRYKLIKTACPSILFRLTYTLCCRLVLLAAVLCSLESEFVYTNESIFVWVLFCMGSIRTLIQIPIYTYMSHMTNIPDISGCTISVDFDADLN